MYYKIDSYTENITPINSHPVRQRVLSAILTVVLFAARYGLPIAGAAGTMAAFLSGCSNVVSWDYKSPEDKWENQTVEINDASRTMLNNRTMDLTINRAERIKGSGDEFSDSVAGVKIFLQQYRAKNGNPNSITFKFSDFQKIGNPNAGWDINIKSFAVSLLNAEAAATDTPKNEDMLTFNLDDDNSLYGIIVNEAAGTVTITNLNNASGPAGGGGVMSNVYISNISVDSSTGNPVVSFDVNALAEQDQWAYLGLMTGGIPHPASGGFYSHTLNGVPSGAQQRIVLKMEDDKELSFNPAEYPEYAGKPVPLSCFHENYIQPYDGARASIDPHNILQMTFPPASNPNAADPGVLLQDDSAVKLTNFSVKNMYDNGGYVSLRIPSSSNNPSVWQDFLKKVTVGLNCRDQSGQEIRYLMDAFLDDPDAYFPHFVTSYSAGYWDVQIPGWCISVHPTNSLVEVLGISFSGQGLSCAIAGVAVSQDGKSVQTLPLAAVNRDQDIIQTGIVLSNISASGLHWSNITIAGKTVEIKGSGEMKNIGRVEALNLTAYTGPYDKNTQTAEHVTSFKVRITASGDITNIRIPAP